MNEDLSKKEELSRKVLDLLENSGINEDALLCKLP